jgi:AraC family transcriptional regulator of adaptative response / DNA-3-methyladenine glycosylase II
MNASARGPLNGATEGRARRATMEAPAPLDFGWLLGFLGERAVPGLEEVGGGEYRRGIRLPGRTAAIGVRLSGGADRPRLALRFAGDLAPRQAVALTRRMFDLDAPLEEFIGRMRGDPLLGKIVARRPGIRLTVYTDPFEGLVRAILGQQVSVAGARTVAGRLVRRFGERAPRLGESELGVFPAAAALAEVPAAKLQALGLTGAKSRSIQALARQVAGGALDLQALSAAPTAAAQAALVALPGIGPWTAGYVAMRALGHRDAFPVGDLGVVKALMRLDPAGQRPGLADQERVFRSWQPWRAYAALHLWSSLAAAPGE